MKKRSGASKFAWLKSGELLPYLFALSALCLVVWVRVRLLSTPFERDEGEFAYAGQLILKGFPPYLHAFSMKLPGMFYLNALIMKCFGESVKGVHLGLLAANILAAGLLFRTGSRLFGNAAGAVSAGLFGLMTLSQHLLGIFAHATHFVLLFVLAACVLIVNPSKKISPYSYLAAGALLGTAMIIKQHAFLFTFAALLFLFLESRPMREAAGNAITMLTGCGLPYLLCLLLSVWHGTFSSFWLWTVRYAGSYATDLTLFMGWINFRSQMEMILSSMLLYWLMATAGLLVLLFGSSRTARNFLLPLLFCSFLSLCPGFHFRPHYFILITPVIALLAASLFDSSSLPKTARRMLIFTLFTAALFQLWRERWFLFTATPERYVRQAYQTTKPFVETVAVAKYIKANTAPSDRILVLGSEPQIYFYADRLSATGHIYMYPLMEEQPYAVRMQEEMMSQIIASRPRYVILVDDLSSWLSVSAQGSDFRRRLNDFVRNGYILDGVASVSREGNSFTIFGARARQFIPDSGSRILVYRIKN